MASVAYLSDGVMSLALIEYKADTAAGKATSPKNEGKEFVGLHHLGFWVNNIEGTKEVLEENGGQYMLGEVSVNTDDDPGYYAIKYPDPNNVIVDITHSGWTGPIKHP